MTKQASPVRSRKNELRDRASRQRKQQNTLLLSVGGVVLAILAVVVYLNIRNTLPVAGEESYPTQGNAHIDQDTASPVVYNSIPPSSGPHYGGLANWGVYDTPIRYEQVVHNLEDGGVLIYYQCPEGCAEDVAKLKELAQPYINAGQHVVMLPNDPAFTAGGAAPAHKDMGAKFALVAWTKVLKMDTLDLDRMRRFIDKYVMVDHHVAGQG